MAQSSFDIVSEVDLQEVRNAVDQASREIHQRFDFKNTDTSLTLDDEKIELHSVTEDRLKAAYRDGLDAMLADGAPDLRARVMTAGAFLAEAYGRPPQAIVGDDEQPLQIILDTAFTRAQREAT